MKPTPKQQAALDNIAFLIDHMDAQPETTGAIAGGLSIVPQAANPEIAVSGGSAAEFRDLLTSVRAICARNGEDTNWQALDTRIAGLGIGSVTPRTFRLIQ